MTMLLFREANLHSEEAMGLTISVLDLEYLDKHDQEGARWVREDIEILNHYLVKEGYTPFVEPQSLPNFESRSSGHHWYSSLHHLRRAYACMYVKQPLREGAMTDADFEFIFDVSCMAPETHLLSHADYGGYFVPIAMPDGPIYNDNIPGVF